MIYNKQPQQFIIEIEAWLGLIVISVVFIIASIILFFSSLQPQTGYVILLRNNQLKTQAYAAYSGSKGQQLDSSFTFAYEKNGCEKQQKHTFSAEKNNKIRKDLKQDFELIKSNNTETPEFSKFINGIDIYTSEIKTYLSLQDDSTKKITDIVNSFEEFCNDKNSEVIKQISNTKLTIKGLQAQSVVFNTEWLDSIDNLSRYLTKENLPEKEFKATVANQEEARKLYNSLFLLKIDYSERLKGISAAETVVKNTLLEYEIIELDYAKQFDQKKVELLYYSNADQDNIVPPEEISK
jgi:hypothetical protein